MKTYCKTLDPADYPILHETQHAKNISAIVGGGLQHPHRAWEYGIVLHAIREFSPKTVLDVGGGGSCFAPMAAWIDMQVTEVDPADHTAQVAAQSSKIGKPIRFECKDFRKYSGPTDFDAVTCISVIEHVPDDFDFFRKLVQHVRVGGVVALTTDFWPDGQPKVPHHLRTYDEKRLSELVKSVPGIETLGHFDYADRGANVFSYTFASLMVRRVS